MRTCLKSVTPSSLAKRLIKTIGIVGFIVHDTSFHVFVVLKKKKRRKDFQLHAKKAQIWKANVLAVVEAHKAIFWSTSGLNRRTSDSFWFSLEETFIICIRHAPLRGWYYVSNIFQIFAWE